MPSLTSLLNIRVSRVSRIVPRIRPPRAWRVSTWRVSTWRVSTWRLSAAASFAVTRPWPWSAAPPLGGPGLAGAVVGGPLGKAAAVAYGVRHAVGVRTGTRRRRALAGQVVAGAELPGASNRAAASNRAPEPRRRAGAAR